MTSRLGPYWDTLLANTQADEVLFSWDGAPVAGIWKFEGDLYYGLLVDDTVLHGESHNGGTLDDIAAEVFLYAPINEEVAFLLASRARVIDSRRLFVDAPGGRVLRGMHYAVEGVKYAIAEEVAVGDLSDDVLPSPGALV